MKYIFVLLGIFPLFVFAQDIPVIPRPNKVELK